MNRSSMVFDAWAIIAYFKAESPAMERVAALLHQAVDGQITLFMSLLNLGEVYYILGRIKNQTFAKEALARLRSLPINLIAVDEATVLQAATYKMSYPISYADAFALSAAIQLQATLVTGDPEFQRLTDLVEVEFLQRA